LTSVPRLVLRIIDRWLHVPKFGRLPLYSNFLIIPILGYRNLDFSPYWNSLLLFSHRPTYCSDKFRVCKSVRLHTLNRINQQDAATLQVYYLSFR